LKEERRAKLEQEYKANDRAQIKAKDAAPGALPMEEEIEATREPFTPVLSREPVKSSSSWWNTWDGGGTKQDGRKD